MTILQLGLSGCSVNNGKVVINVALARSILTYHAI